MNIDNVQQPIVWSFDTAKQALKKEKTLKNQKNTLERIAIASFIFCGVFATATLITFSAVLPDS